MDDLIYLDYVLREIWSFSWLWLNPTYVMFSVGQILIKLDDIKNLQKLNKIKRIQLKLYFTKCFSFDQTKQNKLKLIIY